MNKAELIDAIAKETGLSKADVKRALDSIINQTSKTLRKGGIVALVGFGSFSVSSRAARTGRNPQTGKELRIASKKVVRFKAGYDLASSVNDPGERGGGGPGRTSEEDDSHLSD